MYTQLVLAANNDRLPPMWTPRHFLTYLRWAWMVEGASQYFSGQVSLYRPAVITRLRDGDKPKFPPSRRDAILLGGTLFDLLDRHAGPQACALLAGRLRREGPTAGLELAFDAQRREIEKAWRITSTTSSIRPAPSPARTRCSTPASAPRPSRRSKARSRKRVEPEREVDLHDLELEDSAEPSSDFDPEFEDPFAGEPRIRRGAGLRSPSREELPPAPDLDFGPAPEFGFEGSAGREVEQGDDEEGDGDGPENPERQASRRSDPGQ